MRCFEIPLYSSLSREATDVHERPNTTVDTEDDLIVHEGLVAEGNISSFWCDFIFCIKTLDVRPITLFGIVVTSNK